MSEKHAVKQARVARIACAALVALGLSGCGVLESLRPNDTADLRDMRLVGFHNLQGRSAYQPVIHQQEGRWIAYVGHHGGTPDKPTKHNTLTGKDEYNGTSLLDVTDPANPVLLSQDRKSVV